MSDAPDSSPVPDRSGREPGKPGAGPDWTGSGPDAAGRDWDEGAAPAKPARTAEATDRQQHTRIGIRELRQHASVYVDMAEQGYTVDITNRGRLVAQLIPAGEPASVLKSLVAAGLIEPPEETGGLAGIEPYPTPFADAGAAGRRSASEMLRQMREEGG